MARNEVRRVHDEFSSLIANQRGVVHAHEDLHLDSKIARFPSFMLRVHNPLQAMTSITHTMQWLSQSEMLAIGVREAMRSKEPVAATLE
jgi:hypothetical protein